MEKNSVQGKGDILTDDDDWDNAWELALKKVSASKPNTWKYHYTREEGGFRVNTDGEKQHAIMVYARPGSTALDMMTARYDDLHHQNFTTKPPLR